MDADARLYAFDISPEARAKAEELSRADPRLVFHACSQTELTPDHIDGRTPDFVFLDASHDLDLNRETFRRLREMIGADTVLAIHDTGTVPRELLEKIDHWALSVDEGWVADEYGVQSGERVRELGPRRLPGVLAAASALQAHTSLRDHPGPAARAARATVVTRASMPRRAA